MQAFPSSTSYAFESGEGTRLAESSEAGPWSTDPRTSRAPLLADRRQGARRRLGKRQVAMRDAHAVALRLQVVACRLRERNRAVLPTGASHSDGELLLALGNVAGHDAVEQRPPARFELFGLGTVQHEIANRLIEAREATQLRLVVGIRQKANVHDEVGVERRTMLEPERVDGHRQSLLLGTGCEQSPNGRAELRREHVGGVYHVMGALAQLEQQVALALDTLRDGGAVRAKRVSAAARLVARNQLLVVSIEEEHPIIDAERFELLQLAVQVCKEIAIASIAHDGQTALCIRLAGIPVSSSKLPIRLEGRLSTQK